MIETFFEEAIEIVDDPEIDWVLGEYAEIGEENHSHVKRHVVGREELETDGKK